MKECDLFIAALQKDDPAERAAYLSAACGSDADLRRRVERLLRLHAEAGSFLEPPAVAPGETVDSEPGGPRGEPDRADKGSTGEEQPSLVEVVGTFIGPYKLVQQLGEGGMGVVWVAEQTEPVKRRVALKVIKPGMDSARVLHRFEAERQALALMDHANIAKILDAGATPEGRPYFVMELVKGVPITRYCDELHLSLRERLELFVPVCQAIQHAHQKGIIHRDIKPSNVLVTVQDSLPVPKVIDFGLAKALHQRLTDQSMYTEIGQVVGTLEYMSPEQAELSPLDIDTRTDVYSLGVLLYELLTGTTPLNPKRLQRAAYSEVLRQIREVEPPRPSTRLTESKESLADLSARRRTQPERLMREVRGELDWIVMKCLEKDQTRRYETANSLTRDVERYLHDEPVEACPPSTSYRLRKLARRYRAPLTMAALFAALLVVGAGVSGWLAVRATLAERAAVVAHDAEAEQRQQAEQQRDRAVQAERLAQQRLEQATAAQQQADAARDAAQRQVVKFDITTAVQQADRGEFEHALHWVARAWRDDLARLQPGQTLDPGAEPNHRLRMATAINRLPQLVGFCPHDNPVADADCDPTGDRVVTVSAAHTYGQTEDVVATEVRESVARVWDPRRAELTYPPLRHDGPVTSAVFAAAGDRIATSSTDGTARLWDAATGRPLRTFHLGGPVARVALSPDGKTLAAAAGEAVYRWDMTTGERAGEPLAVGDPTDYVAYSPEGSKLVTVTLKGMARVWDALTGRPLSDRLPFLRFGEEQRHKTIDFIQPFEWQRWPAFSPDGKRLATADGYRIHVWSQDGTTTIQTNPNVPPMQIQAAFTPDGKYMIYVQRRDHWLYVYELASARVVARSWTPRLSCGLAVSPDGKRAAVPVSVGNTSLFDLPAATPAGPQLRIPDYVTRIQFTRDGRSLLTAGWDGTVRLWKPVEASHPPERYDQDCGRADRLEFPNRRFSPDGKWGAMYDAGKKELRVGRVGGPLTPLPRRMVDEYIPGPDGKTRPWVPFVARFSPDGSYLVTCNRDEDGNRGVLESWELNDGEPKRVGIAAVSGSVVNLAFSGNGRRLAASLRSPDWKPTGIHAQVDQFFIWEFPSLTAALGPVGRELMNLSGGLALNWDGGLLAGTQGSTSGVPCWDVRSGERLTGVRLRPGDLFSVDFGPRDNRLLAALSDRTVTQWNARTGGLAGPSLLMPAGSTASRMSKASYSPDQARVVLGVPTRKGFQLNVFSALDGDLLAALTTAEGEEYPEVWFSTDGQRLIAHQPNTTRVRSWRLPEYTAPADQAPALVRLLTGIMEDPSGGFVPLFTDEIRKHRATYLRAFRSWKGLPS